MRIYRPVLLPEVRAKCVHSLRPQPHGKDVDDKVMGQNVFLDFCPTLIFNVLLSFLFIHLYQPQSALLNNKWLSVNLVHFACIEKVFPELGALFDRKKEKPKYLIGLHVYFFCFLITGCLTLTSPTPGDVFLDFIPLIRVSTHLAISMNPQPRSSTNLSPIQLRSRRHITFDWKCRFTLWFFFACCSSVIYRS